MQQQDYLLLKCDSIAIYLMLQTVWVCVAWNMLRTVLLAIKQSTGGKRSTVIIYAVTMDSQLKFNIKSKKELHQLFSTVAQNVHHQALLGQHTKHQRTKFSRFSVCHSSHVSTSNTHSWEASACLTSVKANWHWRYRGKVVVMNTAEGAWNCFDDTQVHQSRVCAHVDSEQTCPKYHSSN